jgi:hypothetical protein
MQNGTIVISDDEEVSLELLTTSLGHFDNSKAHSSKKEKAARQ